MSEDAEVLAARSGHNADASATDASNNDDSALRVFRRIMAPDVFVRAGMCHAVSLDTASTAWSRSGEPDTATEFCTFSIPAALSRAVPSRIRSYLAGRHCAARALALAGSPETVDPLGAREWGAPRWPEGTVGSITHSARLAAAVVLPVAKARGVGIDAELLMDTAAAAEVAQRVLPEAASLGLRHTSVGPLSWPEFVTAVFSAKESIYKCLHPVCGVFFDFDAVHLVEIDPDAGAMRFRLTQSLGPSLEAGVLLTAHFRVGQEHVFSAVRLDAGRVLVGSSVSPPGTNVDRRASADR